MEEIRVRPLKVKELKAYIDSQEFEESAVLPISRHRALSHIENPRAQPDDVILVLVYFNNKMEAYLGVLPDELHFKEGTYRVGWLSCMWVNPILRGKGIAKRLIQTVFDAWDHRILVTEFTVAAKGLYDYTKQFVDLAQPVGVRGYLRFNWSELLPKRDEKWQKWKTVLQLSDALLNIPNSLRLALHKKQSNVVAEQVTTIDEASWQFIHSRKSGELMNRNQAEIEWIYNNPWLKEGPEDKDSKRYHFSSVANRFQFIYLKVKEGEELIGFLLLSVRDQNVKVPYAYFDKENASKMFEVIRQYLFDFKANMLTVFHLDLVTYIQENKTPFYLKRNFQRHYIVTKEFEPFLSTNPLRIQDGDADCSFT